MRIRLGEEVISHRMFVCPDCFEDEDLRERLQGNEVLGGALTTTAAFVGDEMNLAVWFGVHTLSRTVRDVPVLLAKLPIPALVSIDRLPC